MPAELDELARFNVSVGNARGAHLARLLGNPDTRTVVAGQQPCLLAAPLYNTAKAWGAIDHAKRLQAGAKSAVVPVFWIASDDADFDELRRFDLPDTQGRIHRLGRLLSRGVGPGLNASPAYEWQIHHTDRERLLEAARKVLDGHPGGADAVEHMARALSAPGRRENTMAAPYESQFVQALMETLPDDVGPILFVAPRLAGLRRAAVAVLQADTHTHAAIATDVKHLAQEHAKQGWTMPLRRPVEALNFFWHNARQRHPLRRRGEDLIEALDPVALRRSVRSWTNAQLCSEIEDRPENFSPGVVARPSVQDRALRPMTYLAGPGELAYLAIIHNTTAGHYGVWRAPVALRPSVVWNISNVSPNPSEGLEAILREIERLRTTMDISLSELRREQAETMGALDRPLSKTRHSIRRALDRLTDRVLRQGQLWRRPASDHPLNGAQTHLAGPLHDERIMNWAGLLAIGTE